MRQATDREEQRQQAAKPGTGSKQMQRFRHDQLRAGAATHRARMAEQRLHGKRRAGQYDRDCDPRAPAAAAIRRSTAPGATAANARTASARRPSARHVASSRRCPRRRSRRSAPMSQAIPAIRPASALPSARRRSKLRICAVWPSAGSAAAANSRVPNSDASAATCTPRSRDVAMSMALMRWCSGAHGRCTTRHSSFPRRREPRGRLRAASPGFPLARE